MTQVVRHRLTEDATAGAKEAVLSQLRDAMGNGNNLYTAAPAIAEAMSPAERKALWAEMGGEMLYAWAVKFLGTQRRQHSGLPLGYSEDRAEYGRDRREEVLSQWFGVLEEDTPHLAQLGTLDSDGCLGVKANYEREQKANGRWAARFGNLAPAVPDGGTVRDMDWDTFAGIWWAP